MRKFFGIVLIVTGILIIIGTLSHHNAADTAAVENAVVLQPARDMVYNDMVRQYELVSEHGSALDICVRAKLVREAALQGERREDYARWTEIEAAVCKRAGM
jgi:hypothetical protein